MNTPNHQPCYGKLFPETLNGGTKGRAFTMQYVTPVGMLPRRSKPIVDLDAWDECTCCPEFENCFKLSMAKLALANASGAL